MAPKKKVKRGTYTFDLYEKSIIVNGNNSVFFNRIPTTEDINTLHDIICLGEKQKKEQIQERFNRLFD